MKILIIVSNRFNGHEFWLTLKILKQSNIQSHVIAISPKIEDEVTGCAVNVHGILHDFDIETLSEYAGIAVISGNLRDTQVHWYDKVVHDIILKAMELDILIAAICCSVPSIRCAAKGKKVSFFPLNISKDLLREAGAVLTTLSEQVDGKLVTAETQMSTQIWAENIVHILNDTYVDPNLIDVGDITVPKKSNRKLDPEIERLINSIKP